MEFLTKVEVSRVGNKTYNPVITAFLNTKFLNRENEADNILEVNLPVVGSVEIVTEDVLSLNKPLGTIGVPCTLTATSLSRNIGSVAFIYNDGSVTNVVQYDTVSGAGNGFEVDESMVEIETSLLSADTLGKGILYSGFVFTDMPELADNAVLSMPFSETPSEQPPGTTFGGYDDGAGVSLDNDNIVVPSGVSRMMIAASVKLDRSVIDADFTDLDTADVSFAMFVRHDDGSSANFVAEDRLGFEGGWPSELTKIILNTSVMINVSPGDVIDLQIGQGNGEDVTLSAGVYIGGITFIMF